MSLQPPADLDPTPDVPDQIRCVECGGVAKKLPFQPPEGWEPGDVATFRCLECGERWDIEV